MREIIESQKSGIPAGIYSACSANELVIEAVLERAKKDNDYVLIEATANQVNQYGGYTGMHPVDFKNSVFSMAEKTGFPFDRVILGGDHLGPLTWKNLPAEKAMAEAGVLVREFVSAGFTKIHLDTSMHLADDEGNAEFDTATIAERGAVLCETAQTAFNELKKINPDAIEPVYVVGSEVPIPGGAREEEGIRVTRASDFEETVRCFREAFFKRGLRDAWRNVIAVVVQPGVEFGNESIHEYDRTAAKELTAALKKYPDLVFEGHSTDYQTAKALKEMVEDGIAVLKVGPALTFALREGLFALNHIENELFGNDPDTIRSGFIDTLVKAMLKNPENWMRHYHGDENKINLSMKYSFSDRCRYYLPCKEVKESIDVLMKNLNSIEIPLTLISEYMPVQYTKIRNGLLANKPENLAKDRIVNCIDEYLYAAKP